MTPQEPSLHAPQPFWAAMDGTTMRGERSHIYRLADG